MSQRCRVQGAGLERIQPLGGFFGRSREVPGILEILESGEQVGAMCFFLFFFFSGWLAGNPPCSPKNIS